MMDLIANLISGLSLGSIYALIALGYTMVYGIAKMLNFAHGDIFTIGAYLGMTLLVSGGLSGSMTPVLAVGLVVIIVFGLVALLGVALASALNTLGGVVMPVLLSVAAGAMIFIVVEELIPESQAGGHGHGATYGFLIGFWMMAVLGILGG